MLENQKHTVEHAVVESNRLSEMVWNMDVQIAKLTDGGRFAAQTEETVQRVEKVARETAEQLESACKNKEEFAGDLAKLERDRTQLGDFVRWHLDQLAVETKGLDAFEQRVQTLQGSLSTIEKTVDGLAGTGRTVSGLNQKVDGLVKHVAGLASQRTSCRRSTRRWSRWRTGSARSTIYQSARRGSSITSSRAGQDLTVLRKEIQEFYKSQTEISQLSDRVAADRTAFEAFLERLEEFRRHIPELDSRMDAITGQPRSWMREHRRRPTWSR